MSFVISVKEWKVQFTFFFFSQFFLSEVLSVLESALVFLESPVSVKVIEFVFTIDLR